MKRTRAFVSHGALKHSQAPAQAHHPALPLHPRGRQGRDSSANATRRSRGCWSWQHGTSSSPRAACPANGLSQSHLRWAGLQLASSERLPRPLILGSSIKISGPVLKGGKSAGFPGVSEAAGFMSSEVLSLLSQRFPEEYAALWSSLFTFLGILQWL